MSNQETNYDAKIKILMDMIDAEEFIVAKKYRTIDTDNNKYDCYFYAPKYMLVILTTNSDDETTLYDIINTSDPYNKYKSSDGTIMEVPMWDVKIPKIWFDFCKSIAIEQDADKEKQIIDNIIMMYKTHPSFMSKRDNVTNLFDTAYALLLAEKYEESIMAFKTCGEGAKEINEDYTVSTCLYNISCCYALMKNESKNNLAFEYLDKSVDEGYDNFEHAIIDSDLDFIKNKQQFADIIKKMVQKCSNELFEKYSSTYEISIFLDERNIRKNQENDNNEIEI